MMEQVHDQIEHQIHSVLEGLVFRKNYPVSPHVARRAFKDALFSAKLSGVYLPTSNRNDSPVIFSYNFTTNHKDLIHIEHPVIHRDLGRNDPHYGLSPPSTPDFSVASYSKQFGILQEEMLRALFERYGVRVRDLEPESKEGFFHIFKQAGLNFQRKMGDFVRHYQEHALMSVIGSVPDPNEQPVIFGSIINRIENDVFNYLASSEVSSESEGENWKARRVDVPAPSFVRDFIYDKGTRVVINADAHPDSKFVARYVTAEFLWTLCRIKGYPLDHLGKGTRAQIETLYHRDEWAFKHAKELKWDFPLE